MRAESPLIRTIELKDRNGRVVGSKEVVTYQGLLSKEHEEGLKSIRTTLVQVPIKENGQLAISHAEVETRRGTYQGFGDAYPGNVNPFIVPHLIRMAETRALRDAVNIGVVSFDELDGEASASEPFDLGSGAPTRPNGQRNGHKSPRPDPPNPSRLRKAAPRASYPRHSGATSSGSSRTVILGLKGGCAHH